MCLTAETLKIGVRRAENAAPCWVVPVVCTPSVPLTSTSCPIWGLSIRELPESRCVVPLVSVNTYCRRVYWRHPWIVVSIEFLAGYCASSNEAHIIANSVIVNAALVEAPRILRVFKQVSHRSDSAEQVATKLHWAVA